MPHRRDCGRPDHHKKMKSLVNLIFALIAGLLCIPSQADDPLANETYRFHVPRGSPFTTTVSDVEEHSTRQTYQGQLEISGGFRASWAMIDGQPDHIRLNFFPTNSSLKYLPYEEDIFSKKSHVHPVKEIWFLNEDDGLAMLLMPALLTRLKDKVVLSVFGHATIVVSGYETNVDCDRRWYATTLVSVSNSRVNKSENHSRLNGICN